MEDSNDLSVEELLKMQVSYQRRIAKDLHSLYYLIMAGIIIGAIYLIAIVFNH